MVQTTRNIDIEKMQRVADVLKTISHPIRLLILELLEAVEPLNVSEILAELKARVEKGEESELEQSALSHHLSRMKSTGILKSKKKGMNVYYSLQDRHILKIFDCMENCSLI